MKKLLFILNISFLFSCDLTQNNSNKNTRQEPLVIESFYAVNQTAGLRDVRPPRREDLDSVVAEFYLINVLFLDKNTIVLLDSFSCNSLGKKLVNYHQYSLTFYRKSEKTNNEYLLKNTRTLGRYSNYNDMIIQYNWSHNRKIGYRYIYEDGVSIKSEKIDCNCQ